MQFGERSFDGSDVLICYSSSVYIFIFYFSFFSRFSSSLAGLNVPSSHVAVSGPQKILLRSSSISFTCPFKLNNKFLSFEKNPKHYLSREIFKIYEKNINFA